MAYRIFTGAQGSRFVGETGFGEIVARISVRSGVAINSHAREEACRPWLAQIGKHDQAYLFQHQGTQGIGPANPPGRSTHERRNDGVAYRYWPAWVKIPKWARGIDTANSPEFIREAVKEGYTVTLTYPGSVGERQHVNFRRKPKAPRPKPLKRGSKGRRVERATWMLVKIQDGHGNTYLKHRHHTFDHGVEEVVREFQRDHHQHVDGIIGVQTARQLSKSYRYWKAR